MCISKKVKGYIFHHKAHDLYYLSPGHGYVHDQQSAYVYTAQEAKDAGMDRVGTAWGAKEIGKWIIVYE